MGRRTVREDAINAAWLQSGALGPFIAALWKGDGADGLDPEARSELLRDLAETIDRHVPRSKETFSRAVAKAHEQITRLLYDLEGDDDAIDGFIASILAEPAMRVSLTAFGNGEGGLVSRSKVREVRGSRSWREYRRDHPKGAAGHILEALVNGETGYSAGRTSVETHTRHHKPLTVHRYWVQPR